MRNRPGRSHRGRNAAASTRAQAVRCPDLRCAMDHPDGRQCDRMILAPGAPDRQARSCRRRPSGLIDSAYAEPTASLPCSTRDGGAGAGQGVSSRYTKCLEASKPSRRRGLRGSPDRIPVMQCSPSKRGSMNRIRIAAAVFVVLGLAACAPESTKAEPDAKASRTLAAAPLAPRRRHAFGDRDKRIADADTHADTHTRGHDSAGGPAATASRRSAARCARAAACGARAECARVQAADLGAEASARADPGARASPDDQPSGAPGAPGAPGTPGTGRHLRDRQQCRQLLQRRPVLPQGGSGTFDPRPRRRVDHLQARRHGEPVDRGIAREA